MILRRAIIVLAVLDGLLSAPHQVSAEVSRWRFGGEGGRDWGDWARINTFVDVEASPGSIQPWELDPEENFLPMIGPWARWRNPRDPLWRHGMPRIWRGYLDNAQALEWEPRLVLDGDPYTGMAVRNYRALYLSWEYYTIDLGTEVPLERFYFTPKWGADELTGEAYRPSFAQQNFETSAGHADELAAATTEFDYAPLSTLIDHVESNFEFEVEIKFPLQYYRLFRHKAINDTGVMFRTGGNIPHQERYGLGELQLFGRGFVPEVTWESQVVDLGDLSNLGQVHFAISRWRREEDRYVEAPQAPVAARVELKTGLDDTPTVYYTYDQFGSLVEASEDDYVNKLKVQQRPWHPDGVGWRGPIAEDNEAWSYWSALLKSSGIRPGLPRGRYLKIRVRLETESLWEFARMESLVVVTSPVLAERIVGEVAVAGQLRPEGNVAQVSAGEQTEFVYEMRAEFTGAARSGFDAVRVSTPSKALFLGLEMGDPLTAAAADSVVEEDLGFAVYLPRRIDAASDNRLRLRLQTSLYDAATEVAAEAFERSGESLPQAVEPGDATAEVGTDQLRVLVLSSSLDQVLGGVEVRPRSFTPQGDGINDQVELAYTLFSVRSTQVDVGVYTLDGGAVRRLYSGHRSAGLQVETWDGRDDGGVVVAPGLYLLRVEVDADEGRFSRLHPVAVAY